ncbi:hypothetical protein HOLleu_28108 [Holothuria leucospilota]|uniref:Death domain-containing protein n=1 Tax=Holothuria leucospilota TaxID=206669 RepID=A0A9Q1BLI2_HOLLE|nr:hypothetical protein HOLleu_28108 [Holothuria leucospilota]
MSTVKELTNKLRSKGLDVEKYIDDIVIAIKKTTQHDEDNDLRSFVSALQRLLVQPCKKSKSKHGDGLVKICEEGIKQQRKDYYKLATEIFQSKNLVNWTERWHDAENIVGALQQIPSLVRSNGDNECSLEPHSTGLGRALQHCIRHMIDAFARDKIIHRVNRSLVELLINSYASGNDSAYVIGCGITSTGKMHYKGTEDLLPKLFTAMLDWMQRTGNDITEAGVKSSLVADSINGVGALAITAPKELLNVFNYILSKELDGEPMSGYGQCASIIVSTVIIVNASNVEVIKPFIAGTMKLMKCGNKILEKVAQSVILSINMNAGAEIIAPQADDVISSYLSGKGPLLGLTLQSLYTKSPGDVMKYFDRLAEKAALDMPDSEKSAFYMFIGEVAKRQPQTILPHLGNFIKDLQNTSCSHLVFMAIAELSDKFPREVDHHRDTLIQAWVKSPYVAAYACKTLANIGLINEKKADEVLSILGKKLKEVDPMFKAVILMEMKRIGQTYKEILQKYRALIEAEKDGTQMGLPDMVQSIIDFLEDRTLENLSTAVTIQRDDIEDLDFRVTDAELDLEGLDTRVEEQGNALNVTQREMTEQRGRLDTVEVVLDETVDQVQEIDLKTITNAPKWSRDVSKILNPEHEYDWRYLAVRLGYSGEDIRNWALTPDPTMAILAEWYTTHKSSDATFAILTALQDMGRTEAAEIVERALQEADKLIPKPVGEMSDKPCPVFISYQWDHQPEVKTLKGHLEMAGYRCWMDIGQMGGGDQLFAKINEGMRAAKIVLCMVTSKYAKSENCNKEVNLANLLNKSIIPILIENISWPPEGSMSMLFAQLLYIQFFSEGEYVRGEKFWPDDKFCELLGQINYQAAPDPNITTEVEVLFRVNLSA